MPEKRYHRLAYARPRSGFGISLVRRSLWLGDDHLLCVDTTGYLETYKRFYFRDIEAITLTRSKRRRNLNIGIAICAGILGLLVLSIFPENDPTAGFILLGGAGGPLALLLLINSIKGPTVICHLRTAVQTEELSPLNRLRRAHKVLDRLRPLIAEAQGRMEPAEIQALMNQMSAAGGALPAYPPSAGGAPAAPAHPDDLPVP